MSAALFKKAKQKALYAAVLGLFSSGANGAFYDANDWANVCFQDAAGTTPVTAMEQPVGLVLDKSQGLKLGTPLTIASWTNFAGIPYETLTTSGSTIISAINTVSSGYAYTSKTNMVSGLWYAIDFNLTLNSGQQPFISTGNNGSSDNLGSLKLTTIATGKSRIYVLYIGDGNDYFWLRSSASADFALTITVQPIAGNHAYQSTSANRPVITARYNLLLATAVLSTQSVTVGAGSYTLYFTGSGSVALSGAATGTKTAGSNVITCTAGTLTLTVTGSVLTADLRPSDQATGLIPPYQRVDTSTSYDTVGFPVREAYNGSNQLLGGASGGGATTGFFFCAGVMITKAGSAQTLFSDTGTNTGWRVRINASNQLELSAGNGTAYTTVATVGTVSINKLTVVTAWHDGTNLNVQINQGAVAQAAFAVATAGTAGYTLGCDNGASTNYLQGSLGEIVYRTGTAMTAAQIAATQAFVNSKQKAY